MNEEWINELISRIQREAKEMDRMKDHMPSLIMQAGNIARNCCELSGLAGQFYEKNK